MASSHRKENMFERFLRKKGYIKLDEVNQEIDRLIKREFESKYKGKEHYSRRLYTMAALRTLYDRLNK